MGEGRDMRVGRYADCVSRCVHCPCSHGKDGRRDGKGKGTILSDEAIFHLEAESFYNPSLLA